MIFLLAPPFITKLHPTPLFLNLTLCDPFSIATLFSDQSIAMLLSNKSKCSDRKSDCSSEDATVYSELSPLQVDLNIRYMKTIY